MGFVFDRTVTLCITVSTDALVEGHLGIALRAGEASQTVGVESQVQQDADIDIAPNPLRWGQYKTPSLLYFNLSF